MKVGLDQDFQSPKLRRYKGKKDQWDRFVLLDDPIEFELVHYVSGTGYVLCTMSRNKQCHFCTALGEPDERYASNICIYRTDEQGRPFSPLSFILQWWSFPDVHYQQFKVWKRAYGDLRARDIMAFCIEEQYQRMTLSVMPEAWWLMDDQFKAQVALEYKERGIKDLSRVMGTLIPPEGQQAALSGEGGRRNRGGGGGQGASQPNFNPAAALAAAANMPSLQLPSSTASRPANFPAFDPPKDAMGNAELGSLLQSVGVQSPTPTSAAPAHPPMPPQPSQDLAGITPAKAPEAPSKLDDLDSLLSDLGK